MSAHNMPDEYVTALYQRKIAPLPDFKSPEGEFLRKLAARAHTLILPEYFSIHSGLNGFEEIIRYSRETLAWLLKFSALPELRHTLLIGGSLLVSPDADQDAAQPVSGSVEPPPEKPTEKPAQANPAFYNACPVLFRGETLHLYKKRNLYRDENDKLTPGNRSLVFTHPVTKEAWGVMICADVYLNDNFTDYRNAAHIAIPTASPYRPDDTPHDREQRDREIFVKGASVANAMIYKCCSTGESATAGERKARAQGRSLICSPDLVFLKAPDIDWTGALIFKRRRDAATGQKPQTELVPFEAASAGLNNLPDILECDNLEKLKPWLKDLFKNIEPSALFLLSGHLGAGKTTLVRVAAELLGSPDWVNSPTFNIINEYEGRQENTPLTLYHIDCYRLKEETEEVAHFDERATKPYYAFIEWPEKTEIAWEEREIPVYRLTIDLIWDTDRPVRKYRISKWSAK